MSNDTFDGCLAEGYRISVWCRPCDLWVWVDIAAMVAAGRGQESTLNRRWRCTRCGGLGSVTIHAPRTPGQNMGR